MHVLRPVCIEHWRGVVPAVTVKISTNMRCSCHSSLFSLYLWSSLCAD